MNTIGIILSTAGATILLMAAILGFFAKDYVKRFQANFDKLFSSFDKLTNQMGALRGDLRVLKTSYTNLDMSYKEKFSLIDSSIKDMQNKQSDMRRRLMDLEYKAKQ